MSDTDNKIIDAMEFISDVIVRDMRSKYPRILLRCTVCNRTQFGSWSYLKTGWPKCCGYTMRLEADSE